MCCDQPIMRFLNEHGASVVRVPFNLRLKIPVGSLVVRPFRNHLWIARMVPDVDGDNNFEYLYMTPTEMRPSCCYLCPCGFCFEYDITKHRLPLEEYYSMPDVIAVQAQAVTQEDDMKRDVSL
jgi:hypothetical protein